jgi:hypothetical protein
MKRALEVSTEKMAVCSSVSAASPTSPTKVLTADGQTIDLGDLQSYQTIGHIKQLLAEKSGLVAERQQLYVLGDMRQANTDLSLKVGVK